MTYVPRQNPFYVVDKANQMAQRAKGGNAEAFQKMAAVSMCIVAVAAGMQMLTQLWRDLNRDTSRNR